MVLEVARGEGCIEEIETSIGQRFEAFFAPGVKFRTVEVQECRKTKTGKRNPIIRAWLDEVSRTRRRRLPALRLSLLSGAGRKAVITKEAAQPMNLIDTHTHLDGFARRGELPAVLDRALAAGVTSMISIGTDSEDWALIHDLAVAHPGVVHFTVGLHPCSVRENWAAEVAQIEAFWSGAATEAGWKPALLPVALGECGLDRFHLPKDDPARAEQIFAWQQAAFALQLDIAKRLGCPVVVHSRGAFAETVAMIDASGVDWTRVVFHCFSEGPEEMAELVKRGAFGSFTGVLTYKNADNVRASALTQGLDRLMLETDAPYLTPVPHRGKPNEPAFMRHTADYAAGVFGVSVEALAHTTTRTARAFFGI